MQPLSLLPVSVGLSVDGVAIADSAVTLFLRTTAATADCPACGRPSRHVHGRYARHVNDLPYQGRAATLHLTARKFLCKYADYHTPNPHPRLPPMPFRSPIAGTC